MNFYRCPALTIHTEGCTLEPVNILIKQLQEIARTAIELLPQIIVAIFVIFVTWLSVKLVRNILSRTLSKSRLRPSLKELFSLLMSIFVWVLGLMIAAVIVFPGLTPSSILAGLGIGSVAIGFAFKDVFENFLAGIIILFRRTDGQLVIVPNSLLFKNPVTIRTDQDVRRVTVICGVAYDEDVDASRDVITAAVEGCDSVKQDDKPIQVFAQEFASSSINFEVTWWTGSAPVDVRRSRDQVVAAVKRALDDAGIEIPFPYRTLTFKEPLPISGGGAEKAQEG